MPAHDDHCHPATPHAVRVSVALAPCPFCGGALVDLGHTADAAAFIICHACLAAGPLSSTDEEAVWLWNTRVPPEDPHDHPHAEGALR
jgi:Lar family restriction alleviation protein